MPLFAKTRIEIYLPDVPREAYRDMLAVFEREFSYTFGGCTVVRGLEGSYLSRTGQVVRDRLNIIYADWGQSIDEHFPTISRYADTLRGIAFAGLEEEVVLIAVHGVYHSE